ncbi:MAG: PrgI family protein [Candidatus Nealsonbacteria bacterium]|nr:MAG: PrgI family protein [Candidatus Nealsonbacteria bacterium]
MRFTVPKFIEHEAKIVGPLTFKQFIFIGVAGAVGFILYFTVPFSIFLIASLILGGGAMALAFLKIGGRSLPTILGNFLKFSISPKMFIWRKTEAPIKVFKKEKIKKETVEEELPLKIAEKSQLKKLRTQIETKTK